MISIFAVPWYHVGVPGYAIDGQTYGGGSYDGNAFQGRGSFFSVVALIVLIALSRGSRTARFSSQHPARPPAASRRPDPGDRPGPVPAQLTGPRPRAAQAT